MRELFQVIRVLELIEGGELFVEPLEGYRLGVLSGRWLGQSLYFSRRHVLASAEMSVWMRPGLLIDDWRQLQSPSIKACGSRGKQWLRYVWEFLRKSVLNKEQGDAWFTRYVLECFP